jgi:hypothetical protein
MPSLMFMGGRRIKTYCKNWMLKPIIMDHFPPIGGDVSRPKALSTIQPFSL